MVYNILLLIKVNSSDHPVEFGEVVGNACNHDNKKMIEKILKCK